MLNIRITLRLARVVSDIAPLTHAEEGVRKEGIIDGKQEGWNKRVHGQVQGWVDKNSSIWLSVVPLNCKSGQYS